MNLIQYREWTGVPLPAEFRHGDLSMAATIVFIAPGAGYAFVCGDCGFIMRGGNPAACCNCLSKHLLLTEDAKAPVFRLVPAESSP